jgi:hypothetical protein
VWDGDRAKAEKLLAEGVSAQGRNGINSALHAAVCIRRPDLVASFRPRLSAMCALFDLPWMVRQRVYIKRTGALSPAIIDAIRVRAAEAAAGVPAPRLAQIRHADFGGGEVGQGSSQHQDRQTHFLSHVRLPF